VPARTFHVLTVPIDDIDEAGAIEFARESIDAGVPRHIVTVNAEYVMRARQDCKFRSIIEAAELRTADGAGILLAARKRGFKIRRRVGGSDLIWRLSELAAERGFSVFLLGAAPGVAELTADKLREAYPGLKIAGTESGSPAPEADREQVERVRAAKPDILFVAFGSPAQDFWIARNKVQLGIPVCIGVGGSFDYIAGIARRAPVWMQNAGLDWLWRLSRQPWRWRRMRVLPQFAILSLTRMD
jgi:N-acetylglucosaminyldiphosphoundecaprenol N-acetyl-beta-D-mannosaminyltransferase